MNEKCISRVDVCLGRSDVGYFKGYLVSRWEKGLRPMALCCYVSDGICTVYPVSLGILR
jgi:hypothetical protein